MQGTRRILTQTGKDNGYAKVKMLELCDKEFKVILRGGAGGGGEGGKGRGGGRGEK
jgi:hypothetical protein